MGAEDGRARKTPGNAVGTRFPQEVVTESHGDVQHLSPLTVPYFYHCAQSPQQHHSVLDVTLYNMIFYEVPFYKVGILCTL